MTDLIALAKQAGIEIEPLETGYCIAMGLPVGSLPIIDLTPEMLQAFADLIRQDEREACAVLCDSFQYHPVHQTPENCAEAIRARTTT